MPTLDSRHDLMHPIEDDSAWSESYYFNGYDPSTETGLYTRIGVRPNEGTIDVMLALWLPGRKTAFARAKRPQTEMIGPPLEVGGVTYTCIEPGRRWRIEGGLDARLFDPKAIDPTKPRDVAIAVALEFTALTPLIGHDGQSSKQAGASASTRESTGKGHLEQAGRWRGWIEVDGERTPLGDVVRGNRDKSWGPRRWGGPRMWRWFSVNISDDVHFGGIRIGTEDGDLHRGWVWKDGESTSLSEWRVKTETYSDGVTQKRVHVVAVDKRGREHVLEGELLNVFPGGGRKGGTIVNEGLARWTHEGETGYGIAEYLHQFDDDGHPIVPIE